MTTAPAGPGRHTAVPTIRRPAEPEPPQPPRGRLFTLVRGRWLGTITGQIRGYAALALVTLLALLVALGMAIGNARDGVQTIGHDAGPQVVTTGSLYFALSDMDAQVANVLLIGREHQLGVGYDEALRRYERRRTEAGRATVQAAQLAGTDVKRQRTVREVLDGLGRYERLVGEAMLLDRQADHAAGRTPKPVVDTYRAASEMMRLELLPKAYNLTLESGATVRQSYETERGAVVTGRAWVGLTGVLALGVLLALQISLARTFRRLVNPALALATLATFILVTVGVGVLSARAGDLERAKEDGFDSVLALSRARAISHSAFADESRYLLDPGRADTYEQTYLDKSLSVLYLDPGTKPGNLETYYALVEERLAKREPGRKFVDMLGLLGEESRKARPETEAALNRTLTAYGVVLRNDRQLRELVAKGDRDGAIDLRMGRGSGTISSFDAYDKALTDLAETHRRAFEKSIKAGDDGLRGWTLIPPIAVLVIAGLVLVGVRPRLAEFR
ncbi:hypothetical protein [Spirillospora sp. CA-294931]|uniref:hypothetical protein n=1 Tax=Spirillospora sp. CA-294931 TaxID=3240042 RepID=UPI003D89F531